MAGSSVFEYVHVDDHKELADQLELTLATGQPAPSPSSLGSDDTNTNSEGTMNPDGNDSMLNSWGRLRDKIILIIQSNFSQILSRDFNDFGQQFQFHRP